MYLSQYLLIHVPVPLLVTFEPVDDFHATEATPTFVLLTNSMTLKCCVLMEH